MFACGRGNGNNKLRPKKFLSSYFRTGVRLPSAPPRRKKPAPFRFRGFRKSRESSISAGSFLLFPIEARFDGAPNSARLRSPGFVRAGPPSTVLRGSSFSPSKHASMGPPIRGSGVRIKVPTLHHVGRSLLHSASAVSVRAAKAPYPQAPSSFSPSKHASMGPPTPHGSGVPVS